MALAAQGFDRQRPNRVDVRGFRRVLRTLGAVQLDSVNVVARSHYLPFLSRLGPYPRDNLDSFLRTSEVLEYWGHMASVMPVQRYSLLRHRMRAMRPWRRVRRLVDTDPGYIESVYRQVRRSGPLRVADLRNPGTRTGPWWGYSAGKDALEWLFARGRLGAIRNRRFMRLYDLPSRLYPKTVLAEPTVPRREAYAELLLLGARHLGLGTADDLADYYRLRPSEARPTIVRLVRAGRLREVRVGNSDVAFYADPEAVVPRTITGCRVLSPFDSAVWYRPRLERLFGFRYRIEIYVPASTREYGYYVLPVLVDDQFAGRVDLKSHHDTGTLEVRGAYSEDGMVSDRTARLLASELLMMAQWLDLERVRVARRGDLSSPLRKELRG